MTDIFDKTRANPFLTKTAAINTEPLMDTAINFPSVYLFSVENLDQLAGISIKTTGQPCGRYRLEFSTQKMVKMRIKESSAFFASH